ncbi:MAG: lmo0937 family membrane protein [Acidobacteria bacterium]|nr:MAG: lmo0937 family membrane protein [Acidobacteriota bacterium]PYR72908.1 MAG: lmo0937 family membrane protein [Acidobacteriota bacterium]
MLMFLVILLILFWLLGMITATTLGGWLHILLVVAIVFLLIRVIRGQPV